MIKKIKALLSQREMLKNMAVLTGGTLFAQALNFMSSPILSRLFTKEDYGGYGLFMAAVSYASVLACLRLEQAIVLPKEDQEAASITLWAIKLNLIVSSLCIVLSVLAVVFFHVSVYFLLVGPTVFFICLIAIFNYFNSRDKDYKLVSNSRIIISITIAVISIVLGYASIGVYGLIFGMFFGQLVGGGYLFSLLFKRVSSFKNTMKWNELRKKYSDFIFINTPHALLDLTEVYGVVLIMGFFFDKAYIGAYFFAFKILKAPLKLIGSSIYQVLYREFSEKVIQNQSFLTLFKRMIKQLSLFSFPVFLILGLFGKEVFGFIFGNEWLLAGVYSSYFSLWFWLNFVTSPVSCIPIVLNQQRVSFIIAVCNTILRLGILSIAGYYNDFNLLIYLFAISQSIIMLVNLTWYYSLVSKHHAQTI